MPHQPRTYRNNIRETGLASFRVIVKETDLHIQADIDLGEFARERVLYHRGVLEKYLERYPAFATAMNPWQENEPRPEIIETMIVAGRQAGVGPMASVAGAIAASVGADLLDRSREVIVENGGDVFLKTASPITVGLYAGQSVFGARLALRAGGADAPMGICTSSGTIGHSLSHGRADAVCVIAASCALADAAATAIGNRVQDSGDIKNAVEWGRGIDEIEGILVVAGDKIGAWGAVELVPAGKGGHDCSLGPGKKG
jgi:ApbE superfamily uncharacterized protein (UPF0280 family)